jgi:hypothetical protein
MFSVMSRCIAILITVEGRVLGAGLHGGIGILFIDDLGPSGRELFDGLLDGREVSAAHRALVLNAARLADKADELSMAVGGRLTTINSQGTETINPVLSELRMVTSALSQVLAKLGVGELPRVRAGEKSIRDQLAERRAKRAAG